MICSKGTLIKHAAYPLAARAVEYQQYFGKRLDEKTLRGIYEGRGITKQVQQQRRGAPEP